MARHYLTNDELRHANHKYIKRDFINGRWRYWYDEPGKGKTIPKDAQGQKLAREGYKVQQQKAAQKKVQQFKQAVNNTTIFFISSSVVRLIRTCCYDS